MDLSKPASTDLSNSALSTTCAIYRESPLSMNPSTNPSTNLSNLIIQALAPTLFARRALLLFLLVCCRIGVEVEEVLENKL